MPQNLVRKYGKTPAQILLRWNVQQGTIPIPKSKNPARLAENIAVFDFAPHRVCGALFAAPAGLDYRTKNEYNKANTILVFYI